RSSTRLKRWTVWIATVRRDTVSRATCKKSSGKVQRTGLGPGMAASFPCRGFWGVHLLLPKVRRNHDVICGTVHLASNAACPISAEPTHFGMTGGFPIADLVPLEDGYSTTQKIHRQLFNFTAIRLAECHPCHHRQWL